MNHIVDQVALAKLSADKDAANFLMAEGWDLVEVDKGSKTVVVPVFEPGSLVLDSDRYPVSAQYSKHHVELDHIRSNDGQSVIWVGLFELEVDKVLVKKAFYWIS